MNINTLYAAFFCLVASPLHAGEAALFRMTSDTGMVLQELERNDTSSTMEATQGAGSVAAKSMFLLRGSCALMRERKQQAFRIEQLSRQPIRFIVRFVPPALPDQETLGQPMDEHSVISAARCNVIEALLPR